MRKHNFKLGEYKLWSPELCEVTRHNHHFEIDYKRKTTFIPVKDYCNSEELLLEFIAAGFLLCFKGEVKALKAYFDKNDLSQKS